MKMFNFILLIGAAGLFIIVLEMVRRRQLREEYAFLWLVTSAAYLLIALWPGLTVYLSDTLGFSSSENVIFLIGINLLILILIQYSIRLSRLTDRYKDITQQISIIDHELTVTTGDLFKLTRENKAYLYILAASVGARDNYSKEAIELKVALIRILSHYLCWSEKQIEALEFATILHDIGKINIPISALYKTSKLSDEEWDLIKKHPLTSVSILEGIPFLFASIPIIRHHHEYWDGRGYPDGLAGKEIPEGARILCLVDALVALITDRPYRDALSPAEAKKVINDEAGKKFDPKIVEALDNCWDQIELRLQSAPDSNRPINIAPRIISKSQYKDQFDLPEQEIEAEEMVE